jgi:N-dimethylarginine dimethylaminohydrolase
LYFIGSGELTTEECIRDIIKQYSPRIEKPDKNNLFGTTRVALVRDIFDRDENRAHLTDVLALVDEKTMLMVDTIHGRDNLRRRLVNEYVFFDGQFKLSKMDVELSVYLESEGYNVVVVPERLFGGQSIINLADKGLILGSKLLHEEIGASHVKKQIFSMNSYFNFNAPLNQTFLILRKWSGQNHMTTAAAVSRAPIVKYWHQISDKMAKTQTSNTILIVAPIGFCSNLQTLQDNYFMKASAASFKDVEQMALLEFSAFHRTLRSEGVNVVLASNERFYNAPDSCFPNNWFSSHAPAETGGQSTLVLYPMKAEARRAERREQQVSRASLNFCNDKANFNFLQHCVVVVDNAREVLVVHALRTRAIRNVLGGHRRLSHRSYSQSGLLCAVTTCELQGRRELGSLLGILPRSIQST